MGGGPILSNPAITVGTGCDLPILYDGWTCGQVTQYP